MPSEEVIELSVEETNKLRAELGLKPLRLNTKPVVEDPRTESAFLSHGDAKKDEEEALELSVDETNKLREKLGLAPLRTEKSKEVHKPAENTGEKEEVSKRIEQAKLRRQVDDGAARVFGTSTLGLGDDNDVLKEAGQETLSWADRMRKQKTVSVKKENANDKSRSNAIKENYDETDLEGMQVRNNMTGLEVGEDAVLTLADAPILETKTFVSNKVVGLNDEEDALENIGLSEQEKQRDGLQKKRMLEMGMGRAGGYAGFDDDEFEELGGTLGPSNQERGVGTGNGNETKHHGFRIGSQKTMALDASKTDVDRVQAGEAISLVWKGDTVSSDYMTIEEEEELKAKRKKSKEKTKFKKKKKKSKKKRRRAEIDEDDDEDEEASNVFSSIHGAKSGGSVLLKLEETANISESSSLQKRRRSDDMEVDEPMLPLSGGPTSTLDNGVQDKQKDRTNRSTYDRIMEKGNERTRQAFNTVQDVKVKHEADLMDDEPDDSFLNAALAKARRLNRLREMNKSSSTGAAVVAEAVKSSSIENGNGKETAGISFSIDDTREFSRAIRARTQQKERATQKQNSESAAQNGVSEVAEKGQGSSDNDTEKLIKLEDTGDDDEVEDVNMEELAKEIKEEDDIQSGFDGSTAGSVGVGRGLSSFVSMLKTTGEINRKHGGTEELRGRAKDERNYDNYKPMDLSQVVAIGDNATAKDKEFANREIKLEYRDKHGRLLTQKEAYRDLCYQFHGHGASKKKEEKRLRQIQREQAEARLASGQVSAARDGTTVGTLGALKATQKATGKAFVVHKT